MESMHSFWQLGDELRGQSKVSEDHKWLVAASKLAEQTRIKGERMNNLDLSKGPTEMRTREKFGFQEDNKFESINFNMLNLDSKLTESVNKSSSLRNGIYNMNAVYQKNNATLMGNIMGTKYSGNNLISKASNDNISNNNSNNSTANNNNENANSNNAVDKRFKTLPATETLPRNEVLGGYIFVCNNDTMQEDLKRQLFDCFIFILLIVGATSFGGSNIDPTAWEDKKCKGESRFPAQVRIRVRKICKALEEDAFRPVLHHYDGPKFRLELSVPETLDLLDLCEQAGTVA
ncbi:b2 protein [Quercus suber]|uniref:B2 protein n=1 Tax=Quercus suber TaxID=58331 RepID=A0AAW0LAN9_QUESU